MEVNVWRIPSELATPVQEGACLGLDDAGVVQPQCRAPDVKLCEADPCDLLDHDCDLAGAFSFEFLLRWYSVKHKLQRAKGWYCAFAYLKSDISILLQEHSSTSELRPLSTKPEKWRV